MGNEHSKKKSKKSKKRSEKSAIDTITSLFEDEIQYNYFAISLLPPDSLLIVGAEQFVLDIVTSTLTNAECNILSQLECGENGVKIQIEGEPFSNGGNTEKSIQTKLLFCQLLSQFEAQECECVLQSELSRKDGRTTLFFRIEKDTAPDSIICYPMICISPSSKDKLLIVNAPNEQIIDALLDEINQVWDAVGGVQKVTKLRDNTAAKVKLSGYPWSQNDEGKASMRGRRLMLQLTQRLEQMEFSMYGTVNVKNTSDNIYFLHKPDFGLAKEICESAFAIGFNHTNQLSFVNASDEIVNVIQCAVRENWGEYDTLTGVDGEIELQLEGSPWFAVGEEAIKARNLISKIVENLYERLGWSVVNSLDLSRNENEKSIIMFSSIPGGNREAENSEDDDDGERNKTVACLSLIMSDKLQLINLPQSLSIKVVDLVKKIWTDIEVEDMSFPNTIQLRLANKPWNGSSDVDVVKSVNLMRQLMDELDELRWDVVLSADVSGTHNKALGKNLGDDEDNNESGEFQLDVHSWWIKQRARRRKSD